MDGAAHESRRDNKIWRRRAGGPRAHRRPPQGVPTPASGGATLRGSPSSLTPAPALSRQPPQLPARRRAGPGAPPRRDARAPGARRRRRPPRRAVPRPQRPEVPCAPPPLASRPTHAPRRLPPPPRTHPRGRSPPPASCAPLRRPPEGAASGPRQGRCGPELRLLSAAAAAVLRRAVAPGVAAPPQPGLRRGAGGRGARTRCIRGGVPRGAEAPGGSVRELRAPLPPPPPRAGAAVAGPPVHLGAEGVLGCLPGVRRRRRDNRLAACTASCPRPALP